MKAVVCVYVCVCFVCVIESAVAHQLKSYISTNKLDAELQSAYIAKRSTKTALLNVVSSIRLATDQNQRVILVLLDLSTMFDTVDYDILVGRLANRLFVVWFCSIFVAIHKLSLQWLQCLYLQKSYLEGQY